MKALNDDLQMRSDWLIPICGGRAPEERRAQGASDAEARGTAPPLIVAATRPGDVVLDPFFGSGTTGAVAKRLGRRLSASSATKATRDRARAHRRVRGADERVVAVSKREEPRIPFGWLIEPGLLSPGRSAHRPERPLRGARARRRNPARERHGDHRGSIHQVGAAVQGAPACNGWTFWCVTLDGRRVPIDVLRQKLRAEAVVASPSAAPS